MGDKVLVGFVGWVVSNVDALSVARYCSCVWFAEDVYLAECVLDRKIPCVRYVILRVSADNV